MKFSIEGLGHVAEYLRYRPQAIEIITCPPANFAELSALAGEQKVDIRAEKRTRHTKATINLTPLHETELFTFVKNARLGGERESGKESEKRAKRVERESGKKVRELERVIALDHIVDPRNLGAIARSAAFFGISGIIVPKRRQVALTPATVNAARGGFALTDLFLVTNLARTLTKMKDKGYWVIGADMQGEPLASCDFEKQILLFGSEEKGLSVAARKVCDCIMRIGGRERSLQSLNVSVAAGIFIYKQNFLTGG